MTNQKKKRQPQRYSYLTDEMSYTGYAASLGAAYLFREVPNWLARPHSAYFEAFLDNPYDRPNKTKFWERNWKVKGFIKLLDTGNDDTDHGAPIQSCLTEQEAKQMLLMFAEEAQRIVLHQDKITKDELKDYHLALRKWTSRAEKVLFYDRLEDHRIPGVLSTYQVMQKEANDKAQLEALKAEGLFEGDDETLLPGVIPYKPMEDVDAAEVAFKINRQDIDTIANNLENIFAPTQFICFLEEAPQIVEIEPHKKLQNLKVHEAIDVQKEYRIYALDAGILMPVTKTPSLQQAVHSLSVLEKEILQPYLGADTHHKIFVDNAMYRYHYSYWAGHRAKTYDQINSIFSIH